MDLQFPPFWIKFSNYRHQCAPPWDALAVDASILITQPRAFDFKIDWMLTNRAVAVITFSPQGLQGSANLAFNSRYHTQTALELVRRKKAPTTRTKSFSIHQRRKYLREKHKPQHRARGEVSALTVAAQSFMLGLNLPCLDCACKIWACSSISRINPTNHFSLPKI